MIDQFALLREPRRPWIDPEELKSKFLTLSANMHPDRVHGASEKEKLEANQRYSELNAAYNCLREPRNRLLHLLELELERKPETIQPAPRRTMNLFLEVGQICQQVDAFLAERAKITTPILKMQSFEKAMAWTDQLNALQKTIQAQSNTLLEELKALNAPWESAPPPGTKGRREMLPLERLESVYRELSYLTRWAGQIQERGVQLSF